MVHLTRRRIQTASIVNGSGFILASFAMVLWYFLVVRSYPGEAAGQLLLALSVAGLINLLDLGVSQGLISVLSSANDVPHRHSRWNYIRSALLVTTIIELLIAPLAVYWWKKSAFPGLPHIGYFSIVVFAVSTQIILICTGVFKGLCNFSSANLISTGSIVVVYGVGVGAVLMGQDVWTVFLAMACTQFFTACCVVVYANARLPEAVVGMKTSSSGHAWGAYVDLLKTSLKFYPQMFTGIFFMHAQRFIIARYAGIDAVAVISFAYSIATRMHAVVNAFLEVIFPMARQMVVQGLKPNAFCLRMGSISAAAYFSVALVVAAVAKLLIPGIFLVLLAYSVGVMFAVASAPAFHLLNGIGDSARLSVCSLLSPLTFLGLAPLLHGYFALRAEMLLPVAYSLAMAAMLLQVALLVMRHSRQMNASRECIINRPTL